MEKRRTDGQRKKKSREKKGEEVEKKERKWQ